MVRKVRKRPSVDQRLRLVLLGMRNLRKPYRKYRDPPSRAPRSFDCSSFTQYVYGRIGIGLPRRAIDQAACGRKVCLSQTQGLKIGDLLFSRGTSGSYNKRFPRGIGHVAMYIVNGKIIHATNAAVDENGQPGGSVRIDSLKRWLARDRLVVVRRILP